MGDLVRLKCRPETITALAGELTLFGPTEGAPEWLISGVWLCGGATQYLATASVEILPDGFVARTLNIGTAADLLDQVESDLPDVSARLLGRGSGIDLGEVPAAPPAPQSPRPWPAGPYSTSVLVRTSQRASSVHRVACALLFAGEDGHSLLVGTDVSSLAMVMSEDPELIDHYRSSCEALTLTDYLKLCET